MAQLLAVGLVGRARAGGHRAGEAAGQFLLMGSSHARLNFVRSKGPQHDLILRNKNKELKTWVLSPTLNVQSIFSIVYEKKNVIKNCDGITYDKTTLWITHKLCELKIMSNSFISFIFNNSRTRLQHQVYDLVALRKSTRNLV